MNCIFILLIIIYSNFNLYMVCTLSSTIDNFLRFLYINSSYTYQLMLQQFHNCLLMFSILCCIIYSCMLFTFTILCVYVLPYVDMFHIQLSYERDWIFWNIYTYVCTNRSVFVYMPTYIYYLLHSLKQTKDVINLGYSCFT
jgi:hypothetical protein